MYNVLSEVIY